MLHCPFLSCFRIATQFFRRKSIKQNIYEIELEHLESAPSPNTAAIAGIKSKLNKYETDKADITAKAKQFEAARDAARNNAIISAEHSKGMGLSITLFQVAIALGAMCLIVKKKPLWIAAMALGALAVAQMVYVLYVMPL